MELTSKNVIDLTLLFFLMLGLGTSLNLQVFKSFLKSPKPLAIGLLLQFVFQPPLAVLTSKLYNLEPLIAVALVTTACCPGGAISNILAVVFRADIDLSVGE